MAIKYFYFTSYPLVWARRSADNSGGGEGFDIVYDTVGGATLDASFRAARLRILAHRWIEI